MAGDVPVVGRLPRPHGAEGGEDRDDVKATIEMLSATAVLPYQFERDRYRWRPFYGPEPRDARGRPDLPGRLMRLRELVAEQRRELELLAADPETRGIP